MNKCCDPQREREGKVENETIAGEGSGGYNKERPPEDDCCPICFDSFKIPCKTSCGHWFCSSCILRYWRCKPEYKQCKCPMCSQLISKLIPESSPLMQHGEEAGEVLRDVQHYNRLHVGGWRCLFQKSLMLPFVLGRRLRGLLKPDSFADAYNKMRLMGFLMAVLYESSGVHFFPNGADGISEMFKYFGLAVATFLFFHGIWYEWRRVHRERNLAQLQPNA